MKLTTFEGDYPCARACVSSREKQGARVEAVRRSGDRDPDDRDRDVVGGYHVHFLQKPKAQGCPHPVHVLRLEGKRKHVRHNLASLNTGDEFYSSGHKCRLHRTTRFLYPIED